MLCILIYAMPCSILKARVKITESKNYLNAVRIFDFDLYWFKSESLLIAYFFLEELIQQKSISLVKFSNITENRIANN